jgi:hypothetical protein
MMGDLPIVFLTVVIATIVAAVFRMTSHKDERKDKACAVREAIAHQSPHTGVSNLQISGLTGIFYEPISSWPSVGSTNVPEGYPLAL